LGMLFGDPGAGKSFLALAWSWAIASGHDWLRRPVQRGTVFYIAGEGHGGINRRMQAWAEHNGVPLADIRVYVSKYGTNFLDDDELNELIADMRSAPAPIVLVVIDTMARATPGMNEDRADEVGVFVQACDAIKTYFGATVLVLHHSGHRDKARAKGSISLRGAVDFEAGLMRTSNADIVRLTCTKLKDGEEFGDIHLRFESVASSAVLTECDAPTATARTARKAKLGPNDRLFMAALGTEPREESAIRADFIAGHPKGQGDPAKNYRRARDRALRRGWFVELEDHRLSPSSEGVMKDNQER